MITVSFLSVLVGSTFAVQDRGARTGDVNRPRQRGNQPQGWLITAKTTKIENGRRREHHLKPTNRNGKAKDTLRLPSGTYVLEVVAITDLHGFDCTPERCRRCLTIFEIP